MNWINESIPCDFFVKLTCKNFKSNKQQANEQNTYFNIEYHTFSMQTEKLKTVNELVDRGTINIQNNILTDTIFYNQNEKFVRLNDTLFKGTNVEIYY